MNSERFYCMRNCERGFYYVVLWEGRWRTRIRRRMLHRILALFTGV